MMGCDYVRGEREKWRKGERKKGRRGELIKL
jgi:hypothetical protein